jgi:hypothetical protein
MPGQSRGLARAVAAVLLWFAQYQIADMAQAVQLQVEMPDDLARLRLPNGVQHRLQELLDKQDAGQPLTKDEKHEAEGLVDLAELLSLLRLRSERLSSARA